MYVHVCVYVCACLTVCLTKTKFLVARFGVTKEDTLTKIISVTCMQLVSYL